MVALFMGMSPSEYLALKWEYLDLQKARVTVQRSLCETGKGCEM
jgi:integrase